jgi:hypothetical protein
VAITRPCLDTDDPAAVGLYLQALAFDAEAQFTSYADQMSSTDLDAAVILRITANYTPFVGAADQIFLNATTTFDVFESNNNPTGLWAFGFTVLSDPLGAKTATTLRQAIAEAGYTDSFGDWHILSTIYDVEFESNAATRTTLNASGTFSVPEGLEDIGMPDVRLYFSWSNAASNMEILAQSTMWWYHISAHDQLVINA